MFSETVTTLTRNVQIPRLPCEACSGDLRHEGLELSSMQAVQEEAARSLADLLRDAVRRQRQGGDHRMAIEVRDANRPVLTVTVSFEAKPHRLDA